MTPTDRQPRRGEAIKPGQDASPRTPVATRQYAPPLLTSLGNVHDLLGKTAGTPDSSSSGMKD